MLLRRDAPFGGGFWTGLAILALGVALGLFLAPGRGADPAPGQDRTSPGGTRLHPNLTPSDTPAPDAANGLASLGIHVAPRAAERLQNVRDRALERGVIVQSPEDMVPAEIEFEGRRHPAEIRIKGDWTDHVETDKWSFRIKLDDSKILGMRVFSVQSPDTRGKLWEWFVSAALRRENVLAPRGTFVNVALNGNPVGVYYLEEHFAKELLESQGRREGPIVLFDEATRWATMLQVHDLPEKGVQLPVPASARPALDVGSAAVRAFGEKRIASDAGLASSLSSAVDKLRALRELAVTSGSTADALRHMQALDELRGRTVEDLFNVDRLACAHSLLSLFQVFHSLIWHNLRFYHDPVLDRLEPILFDNMADVPSARDPVVFRAPEVTAEFRHSKAYYDALFRYLGSFCRSGYVDELFADLGPDLERFEAALLAEGRLLQRYRIDGMKQRLRAQEQYLRTVLFPVDPLNVASFYVVAPTGSTHLEGEVEVRAWATTGTPVVVEGFRFQNDSFTPARAVLTDTDGRVSFDGASGTGVVLPHDGRPATFRFPLDQRLANLENVRQIKDAIRTGSEGGTSLDLAIRIVFRPIAAAPAEATEEALLFRVQDGEPALGRPAPPTVTQALQRHPFLTYDVARRRMVTRPGAWDVEGDLHLPAGVPLDATGPLVLRFEPDAALISDAALDWEGTADEPILLEPQGQDPAATWRGIVVLGARETSRWSNVTVRATDALARGGWRMTGGVTFYHAAVELTDCTFDGSQAEDGLNVFGTELRMERVTFSGCVSDSFDGDFVHGTIRNCTFRDGLADGLDFSGSDVDIVDCRFERLNDKALSIGENTVARIRGGAAVDVTIGIAAKDASDVDVRDFRITGARHYGLAAFVKKPEFGPSRLEAVRLTIEASGLGDTLVQTGCEVIWEGERLATRELDVEALYRDKILGQ